MTAGLASAEPWLPPGDLRLRHDLERLASAGHLEIPLTSWPLSWGDVGLALGKIRPDELATGERSAYERLQDELRWATRIDEFKPRLRASFAAEPRRARSFEDTPRDEAELGASLRWVGERLAFNLSATAVADPFDGKELRPDGSYVGLAIGNWMFSAGWQDRWWGPGRDGSLMLSSNARPVPALALQRNLSLPFESRWLNWIGPWTLSAFMGELDDERVVRDAWLFGLRVTARPLQGLEIGVTRTAQWCGEERPCDGSTFVDLLLGKDNQGVNVDPAREPGNQLASIDLRWNLSILPLAFYLQWAAEDSRQGGPEIGSWLRQAGVELWGDAGNAQYRAHLEIADTACRSGGAGLSRVIPNCGYEHFIYRTGYRYRGRPLAHGIDGDGLSYSLGSTLVQSAGRSWNLSIRYMEINRVGAPSARHTLSATPQDLGDIKVSHDRLTPYGRFNFGLGYTRVKDSRTAGRDDDLMAFVQWTIE